MTLHLSFAPLERWHVINLNEEHSIVQIQSVMSSSFDNGFDEHIKHFFSKYF